MIKKLSVQSADHFTFDVTSFGADPVGTSDSSLAVQRALEAAADVPDNKLKTIFFPRGIYHFYEDYSQIREYYISNTVGLDQRYKQKHLGILIEKMMNITLDGGGSLFLFHGNITSFAITQSKNIVLTNFSLDYSDPGVHEVIVESKVPGENAVIVSVPDCFKYSLSDDKRHIHWTSEAGPISGKFYLTGYNESYTFTATGEKSSYNQKFYLKSGRLVRGKGVWDNISKIEDLGSNQLKFTYNGVLPEVGISYQSRNIVRTTPGAFIWESEDITLRDVNIHYLHTIGIVGQLSKNITMDGVNLSPRPGSKRTAASSADFFQMSSVGGTILVENCKFIGAHDDAINIHGTFLVVKEVSTDSKTFLLEYCHTQTAGFPQFYVGNTIEFAVRDSMIPIMDSLCTVTAVENWVDGDGTRIRITVDKAVDGILADKAVVENVTYTPEVIIRNCYFASIPTRGILTTTRRSVLIENNVFKTVERYGVFISCDAQEWYESGRTEDVVIRNNTFEGLNNTAIAYISTGVNDSSRRLHKNLLVEGNIFRLIESDNTAPPEYAMLLDLKSVENVIVRDNFIQRYNPYVKMTLSVQSQSLTFGTQQKTVLTVMGTRLEKNLYRFENCKHVVIQNNDYDDGLNQSALLSSFTMKSDIEMIGDDIDINCDNQKEVIKNIKYVSTNPLAITVDSSGLVSAVGIGTSDVYASAESGVRTVESNRLRFTVKGGLL